MVLARRVGTGANWWRGDEQAGVGGHCFCRLPVVISPGSENRKPHPHSLPAFLPHFFLTPLPTLPPPQALRRVLPPLLSRLRPELVMYNAGVDVHGEDSLGKMALTDAGILARDRFVFAACAEAGAPVACAIGGGYSPEHEKIVERHVLLHRAAAEHLPALAASASAAARVQRRR